MSVKTAGGSLTSRPVELARAGVNDVFAGAGRERHHDRLWALLRRAHLRSPAQHLARLRHRRDIISAVTARGCRVAKLAGPDPTTVAVTATLVSAPMARLAKQGLPDDLLAPVAIIMALSAALTGVLLFGLGLARAGGAIRFIPYPVIGGFLGASGCLMVSGAVRVLRDRHHEPRHAARSPRRRSRPGARGLRERGDRGASS